MRDKNDPAESEVLPRRKPSDGASGGNGGLSDDAALQLVFECQAGDRVAQRRLYEVFHKQIYRVMFRLVGAEIAADLTQQVFLQAFRKIGQYSGRGRFDRWLYRLAVNEAYQHLRRKRRDRHTTLVYEPVDASAGGDRRTEQRELMEYALARLDPELRSIFLLREVEEHSYRELAETLDIPEGTVGSRLNRARRELRDHLVNLGWEP